MKADPTWQQVRQELRAIYTELESKALPRDCTLRTRCCKFRLTGAVPSVTHAEAMLAAEGVRASGRKKLQPRADGSCPCLGKDGFCTIYHHRPFGCRSHFCQEAGGMYPRKHVANLIHRLEQLDEQLGYTDGPRDYTRALEDAVESLNRRK